MKVGTVLFQMWMALSVAYFVCSMAMEHAQARFRRQCEKGAAVLCLLERGTLRKVL